MPPQKRRGGRGQTALSVVEKGLSAPDPSPLPRTGGQRRRVGRVERGVNAAITAYRGDRAADPRHAGHEALARDLAAHIDRAADQPYAIPNLAARLLETMGWLSLASGAGTDPVEALLADIATPTVDDTA